MSNVSNRFYVESIDDGSTLHGQLLSTKALTQAWTGSTAVPNWRAAGNQPIVYVDLMSGATKVTPDSGGTWYYNNVEIEWSSSSPTSVSTDERFQKVNNYPTEQNPTAAIKIINNLASGGNINTDSLSYSGAYTLGGSPIPFSVSTFVRITGISSSGIFGFIEFIGSNIITEDNPNVTMVAHLFSADGNEISASASGSPFSTAWKMNNVSIGDGTDVTVGSQTYHNAKQVSESQITDNSVIECTFTYITRVDGTETTLTYSTFENVDDRTDPEQMYIQYNGGNDTSATLKRGKSITFNIWMGRQDDSTVDTSWQTFYVKLLNSAGTTVMDNISNIPSAITDTEDPLYGFRDLSGSWDGSAVHITLSYDVVSSSMFNKYLTGIVLAEQGQSQV